MKRFRTITSFYQVASSQESNKIIQDVEIGTNLDANENNPESLDVGTAQNNMESTDVSGNMQSNPNVMLNQNNIVGDPGLRKRIEELDVNIRDAVRREYLLLGPCQPKGHIFPKKQIGDRQRMDLGIFLRGELTSMELGMVHNRMEYLATYSAEIKECDAPE